MKIISKPDVSSWSHSCTCKNCETQLEIEAIDLHYTYSEGDGIHPASDNYYAQCPVCLQEAGLLSNASEELRSWYKIHESFEIDKVKLEAVQKLTKRERRLLNINFDELEHNANIEIKLRTEQGLIK